MTTMDKHQVAKLLNVKVDVAYGLLRFMSETKCATTSKADRAKSKKGRSTTLYHFDQSSIEKLSVMIKQLINSTPQQATEPKRVIAPVIAKKSIEVDKITDNDETATAARFR